MSNELDLVGQPLPYCGPELDRRRNLGRPFFRRSFGSDHSGQRTYRFNRLGFRSGEFDPAAPYRVFAFGESHAFGYFVDYEECWPSRFADLWIRHRQLDPSDVCYLNFADAGASNGSIARAVVSQCSALRPDLVLVQFSGHERSEVLLDGTPHRIGRWLLLEEDAVADAPSDDLGRTLLELTERAKSFYRYAVGPDGRRRREDETSPTCLLDTLRNILLVQYFCESQQIPLVATCEYVDALLSPAAQEDPTLGPLVRQLDPEVFCDFGVWDLPGDLTEDGGHVGSQRHERFAQAIFDFYLRKSRAAAAFAIKEPSPVPEEPVLDEPDPDEPVRAFYQALPFNHYGDVQAEAESLRDNVIPSTYPDLHHVLSQAEVRSVADCGCGTGWLSNTLALHYDVEVKGIDFTSRALDRARDVASRLGVDRRVRLVEADLLELSTDERFDLVVSLGVLHHMEDPRQAFDCIQRLARLGSHVYIGLYHQPGRGPFLRHFCEILERGGEEAALAEFRRLRSDSGDDEQQLSWFRDQVLHPRETQHTLREVVEWLDAAGLELVSTSINRFQPFTDLEALFELEAGYEERSRRALQELRFFPGFFTFMAWRPE